MSFKCQKESYLRSYSSRVVSCRAAEGREGEYEVVLEDTILFPEGGGQVRVCKFCCCFFMNFLCFSRMTEER